MYINVHASTDVPCYSYSLDSTVRSHFPWPSDKPQAIPSRHGFNSGHRHVASGIGTVGAGAGMLSNY